MIFFDAETADAGAVAGFRRHQREQAGGDFNLLAPARAAAERKRRQTAVVRAAAQRATGWMR
jgi:hypothetical protein